MDPLLSLPSRLVEQRPYIKPHEALLHAATAEVPHLRRWRVANHWGKEDSRMIQLSREVARR